MIEANRVTSAAFLPRFGGSLDSKDDRTHYGTEIGFWVFLDAFPAPHVLLESISYRHDQNCQVEVAGLSPVLNPNEYPEWAETK